MNTKPLNILFLDDELARWEIFKRRFPLDNLVFAQNLHDGHKALLDHINGTEYFDIIHFDHDLYDNNLKVWLNSQALATWFVENCPKDRKPKIAVIHSINDQGAWALYHIFMRLVKTWRSPFRLETREEYIMAADIGLSLEPKEG